MHLSVIIPAFNEEGRILKTLADINSYLAGQFYDSEILVVDGGSKDRTREVVKEKIGEIKNLKLIEIKGLGKGHAVKTGMLQATGDFRIFTDADNSTPINQIEKMWPYFEQGYDVVIGSRDVKGAILDPPQPWNRRLFGDAFKLYRKIIIGLWGIEDTQCGFKAFSKQAAEKIFPLSRINHFSFDPEVLVLARKFGYKIREVPITWKNDLESKVGFGSILSMAIELLKLRINLLKRVYG